LQDFEYRPVGGALVRNANVRIIAASNANLDALQRDHHFRQDLLFRLNVLAVNLPSLRMRQNDVVLLAELFLKRLAEHYRRPPKCLSEDAVSRLLGYAWPGNVRELENLMHREFLMTDSPVMDLRCLDATGTRDKNVDAAAVKRLTASRFQDAKASAIANFERNYIVELLSRTHGNISQAARISGKERSRLGKLVKKYGLERLAFVREVEADNLAGGFK
jgi:DNA-binding NtrC family response regulator